MRKIDKTNPPGSFQSYVRTKTPTPNYNDLPKIVAEDLRLSLLNEQGWVCGYCQQQIKDSNKTKIEHHCEQSICNGDDGTADRTLDYTNLMVVCLGRTPKELHCDTLKATFKPGKGLPIDISPWNSSHVASMEYSSNGIIRSKISKHDQEINNILNLNIDHLQQLRKKKFISFFKAIKGLDKNSSKVKNKLKVILQRDLEKGNITDTTTGRQIHKFSNSFPGLSEYMLRKFC